MSSPIRSLLVPVVVLALSPSCVTEAPSASSGDASEGASVIVAGLGGAHGKDDDDKADKSKGHGWRDHKDRHNDGWCREPPHSKNKSHMDDCDDEEEDACATNNGGCDVHATCASTTAGVTCACKVGYTGSGDHCADMNECVQGNGGCSGYGICTNTDGGFYCTCKAGYEGDGKTCTAVN